MQKKIRVFHIDLRAMTEKQRQRYILKVLKDSGFDLNRQYEVREMAGYREYSQGAK